MAKVLFKNVNVLDGTGAPPFAGQVLVEGNRIKAVAPRGAAIASDESQVVDGGGATLMPGLVEGLRAAGRAHAADGSERQEAAGPGLHRLQQCGIG